MLRYRARRCTPGNAGGLGVTRARASTRICRLGDRPRRTISLATHGRRTTHRALRAEDNMSLRLLREDELGRKRERDPSEQQDTEISDNSRLVCRTCATTIAAADAVLPRGDWPLIFANPQGLVFELVLLEAAQAL